MENFEKIDVRNQITRNSYFYDNKIQYFKGQNYLALKNECLKSGRMFSDPYFTPSNASLYYSKPIPHNIKWLRPHEIVRSNLKPEFIVNKIEAHDLDQGYLGNCWFIAGCAAITQMPDLFAKVVPQSQTFAEKDYCGIFHFRFWIYGFWYDIVVDDYLPVWDHNKQLAFCSNKEEPNEFWAALLEKAYAKICGNYENLEGGFTSDALIDLTGGIEETFLLDSRDSEKNKNNLWKIIYKSREHKSMAAVYIEENPHVFEERLPNGLIKGHAYTISKIALLKVQNREIKLLRLRNPWGRIEWKGAWSDHSSDWSKVSIDIKNSIEFKIENEGEFWMSFEDFCECFNSIQFCHLTPDAFSDEILKTAQNSSIGWKIVAYHGEWSSSGRTAGGSGNGGDPRFWLNPQFLIKLEDVDQNDSDNMATVIIALMQKYTREKRTSRNGEMAEEFIQFRVFKVINDLDADNSIRNGSTLGENQLEKVGNSGNYINKREITARFKLVPGYYLIIPSTFECNCDGEFLVRVFTEKLINSRNSVILHSNSSNDDIASKYSRLNLNESNKDVPYSNRINPDDGFKSLVCVLGHKAVEKVSEKADKAKESVLNHVIAKSQFTGNLFSKLLPDEEGQNIKKEFVTLKNNLKVHQACSLM